MEKGRCSRKSSFLRFYKIRLRNGNIVGRNKRHIPPAKQLQESDDEYNPLDDNINLEEAANTEQPPDLEC